MATTMDSNDFDGYIDTVLQMGYLSLAIAVGKDTGLIGFMCDAEHPATVADIAGSNKLKERYVKEWLGAMVSGAIVEVDSESRLYYIPQKNRARLTKGDMEMFPMMTLLASLRERVKSCFQEDGPSGYQISCYPEYYTYFNKYRESMAENIVDKDIVPSLVDVREKLEKDAMFAELGCGTGNMITRLAKRFPNSTFIGVDYGHSAVEQAMELSTRDSVNNVVFLHENVETLPESWTGRFDVVLVFDVIHDTCNPDKILSEIHRIMKKDGIFSMTEINTSSSHFENKNNQLMARYYAFSIYSCLPGALAEPPFAGLGICWGLANIRKTLSNSGFEIVKEVLLIQQSHVNFICKKMDK